jgi:hypothetical protein
MIGDLAFPDHDNSITEPLQPIYSSPVTLSVGSELVDPKSPV